MMETPSPPRQTETPRLTHLTQTVLPHMRCFICSSHYEVEGHLQPRMLRCGHTFCTSCILGISDSISIQCPHCATVTSVKAIASVYALPINLSLIKLINDLNCTDCSEDEDLCKGCKTEKATKVCFSCDPEGCKLCERCCTSEHERDFAPVRAHKPILITDLKSKPRNMCRTHTGHSIMYYSEKAEKFACQEYLNRLPDHTKADYVQVEVAIQTMKSRVAAVMQKLDGYLRRLELSQDRVASAQSQVLEAGPKTIQEIQEQFTTFQEIFQQRQEIILGNVTKCLTIRKERTQLQLSELREVTAALINQRELLRSNMKMGGKDFLANYKATVSKTCALLNSENPALQRPACEAEISVYIPNDFTANLRDVGSVGGGPDVINFEVQMHGGLLRLTWNVHHRNNDKIKEYEIEYQVVPVSLDSEGPSSVICEGYTLKYSMNCLCPGYTYTFRMRSSIFSGWGMWTKPLIVKYDDFPCTISYNGRIVQVKIPDTGRYQITAKGAKAADGKHCNGGRGAIISAVFTLLKGDVLDILCGGMSVCHGFHSGGGGGTFVSVNTRQLEGILVVAGGGGGTRGYDSEDLDGCDASLEPHGTMANGKNCAKGGVDGAPGQDATLTGPPWGFGGAGWQKNSTTAKSFVEGGNGGDCGGFGGGGGVGMYGGGGGGGFSGGGGGRGGGGGGSYVREDGDNITKEVGNIHHGEVKIERLSLHASSSDTSDEIVTLSPTSSYSIY